MRPEDAAFAADCVAGEGWTGETRQAFEGYIEYDAGGCFLAEESGRSAGICVATSYGRCGFIGDLIVRREERIRGIGPKLLDSAVRYLHRRGAENIYLDGVERAVPYYELVGFRPVCRSLRFAGWADEMLQVGARTDERGSIRKMESRDLPEVSRLDREAFGADRGYFLERRRSLYPELGWVAEDGEGIAGFILGHIGNDVVSLGPWILAKRWPRPGDLFRAVCAEAGDRRLRVGVLETSEAAVRFLRSVHGLAEIPASRRMVLGASDRLGNSPLCWAIGSPAKG